jgi:integrase
VKWVKLSESNVPAVHREADRLRDEATGSLDIPGVYVSGTGTTYKVVFSAVERDSRGHVRRRQRTRNFPRRDTYGPVTLPDFGKREHPTALEAAYAFKLKADAAAKAGKTARSDDVTMADLFAMFLASKPRRPTTESYYRSTYGKHIEPTFGSWYVKAMDVAAVERWHAELEAKPAAKRAALQVLKAMTSYATRRGLMESDPARSLAVPQNNVRALRADEIPTREQVERLASEVGEDYRALVLLLAYGGLRIGEAVALRGPPRPRPTPHHHRRQRLRGRWRPDVRSDQDRRRYAHHHRSSVPDGRVGRACRAAPDRERARVLRARRWAAAAGKLPPSRVRPCGSACRARQAEPARPPPHGSVYARRSGRIGHRDCS